MMSTRATSKDISSVAQKPEENRIRKFHGDVLTKAEKTGNNYEF